jgi:hypothetical protein
VLVLAPFGRWSPHWKARPSPTQRNEILAGFARLSQQHVLAAAHFGDRFTPCDWLRGTLPTLDPAQVAWCNLDACDMRYDAVRQTVTGNLILFVRRTEHRRVLNQPELVNATCARFRDHVVVDANPGALERAVQGALVLSARAVVGMHGGGMWQAGRFMGAGQAMLEILPVHSPGTTKHIARGVSVAYCEMVCEACVRETKGVGRVPVDDVLAVLEHMLCVKRNAVAGCDVSRKML